MQNNCSSRNRVITVQCRIFALSVIFFHVYYQERWKTNRLKRSLVVQLFCIRQYDTEADQTQRPCSLKAFQTTNVGIPSFILVCMCQCMYVCVNVCMYACMHVCVKNRAHVQIHAQLPRHRYTLRSQDTSTHAQSWPNPHGRWHMLKHSHPLMPALTHTYQIRRSPQYELAHAGTAENKQHGRVATYCHFLNFWQSVTLDGQYCVIFFFRWFATRAGNLSLVHCVGRSMSLWTQTAAFSRWQKHAYCRWMERHTQFSLETRVYTNS
jgi:hypothetical protein